MGLLHFDDWASDFGETITAIELSPEGSGYRAKTRFAKFFNLPELMSTFKMVADIQTADMLRLPVPKANFHTEVITPSEIQQEMVAGLAERAEVIRSGGVDPSIDNMLRITNDGRKLALDMRLINPLAADDPNGKVATCAGNVYRIGDQTQQQRSAQLVFCDLSTPKGDGSFNVYDDLRQKLMDMGIPEEEIAFIHDANTEVRKKELFARVRAGQVRILMGSTQKIGAGTNVQDKPIALHDLNCPWRPSDDGRTLRTYTKSGTPIEVSPIFSRKDVRSCFVSLGGCSIPVERAGVILQKCRLKTLCNFSKNKSSVLSLKSCGRGLRDILSMLLDNRTRIRQVHQFRCAKA